MSPERGDTPPGADWKAPSGGEPRSEGGESVEDAAYKEGDEGVEIADRAEVDLNQVLKTFKDLERRAREARRAGKEEEAGALQAAAEKIHGRILGVIGEFRKEAREAGMIQI